MRLIDADELKKETTQFGDLYGFNPVWQIIDNAPTVEPFERIGTICNENCGYKPQGEWIEFADFIARNVVSEDFSEDVDFYAEVLCRKLVKLGLVKLDGDTYKYCGADMKGGAE